MQFVPAPQGAAGSPGKSTSQQVGLLPPQKGGADSSAQSTSRTEVDKQVQGGADQQPAAGATPAAAKNKAHIAGGSHKDTSAGNDRAALASAEQSRSASMTHSRSAQNGPAAKGTPSQQTSGGPLHQAESAGVTRDSSKHQGAEQEQQLLNKPPGFGKQVPGASEPRQVAPVSIAGSGTQQAGGSSMHQHVPGHRAALAGPASGNDSDSGSDMDLDLEEGELVAPSPQKAHTPPPPKAAESPSPPVVPANISVSPPAGEQEPSAARRPDVPDHQAGSSNGGGSVQKRGRSRSPSPGRSTKTQRLTGG
jgi:hypothetical protein